MDENAKIDNIRHSLAHLLAAAVKQIWPKAKNAIGPAIENGFYQDFDLSACHAQAGMGKVKVSEADFEKIEKKMCEILKGWGDFKVKEVSVQQAKKDFKDNPYKLELIKDFAKQGKKITENNPGNFLDLCKGGHIKDIKEINPDSFKLTKVAGAYWKGNEKNKMLTRIYGVAFETEKELIDYLKMQEEAEKRDHRILGQKLDLFVFSDLVGKGLPLFTEKGAVIRRELEKLALEEEIKRGYKHVITPDLAKVDLYRKSGHYPYYKESMYPVMKIDEEELILRPMTCPHHYQLYLSKPRSYRELPFRLAELAKQFRYEKSGELTGLIRVRSFCLADAHIITQQENVESEMNKVLDLIEFMANIFGLKPNLDYRYRLSLGDRKNAKKYYKDDNAWNFAENILRKVLKDRNAPFFEAEKEAAFYGPKVDIQMKNFSGKEDTAFTVQYDFVGPKRFNLVYTDKDGKEKEAIVIHRSSIGCVERIMAFLIEKYAGAFPVWLSPIQVAVIPISEKHLNYANEISKIFQKENFRYQIITENETLGKKIREAEMQKIPYLLIIGDKEIASQLVSIRERGKGDLGQMQLSNFLDKIKREIEQKIS